LLRFLFKSKRNDENPERRFWIYASGEFLLVFLGILIALQVENWNQNRQDRKLEKVLLLEMKANLEQDLADIDYNLHAKRYCSQSNQVVMSFLNGDLHWHDSLDMHFGGLITATVFVNNTSTFESLKSIGIDLVRNDDLRQLITFVYSARYDHVDAKEAESLQANFDFLYPTLKQHLEFLPGGKAIPVDTISLRQSHIFRSDLRTYRHLLGLNINAYEMTRRTVVELIAAIEQDVGS
jgi:hypothetical protein